MTISFHGWPITVEAGFSAATGTDYGIWDLSVWNTGTWGPDLIWTDISAWVISITTRRGFARHLQAWEPGSANIVLNNRDGRFSTANLSGPYVIGGVTSIRPWRPIRIRVAGLPLYTGYAIAWNETYSRAHATSTVTVPCKDEFAYLARVDGFETNEQGDGELSGARIHRILDSAGHTGDRNIDEGRITMQATTLEDKPVSELALTADSEGGAIWVEPSGAVKFHHRYALAEEPRSNTIQATFGDGDGSAGEVLCSDIKTSDDGDLVCNIAAFSRKNGVAQVAADPASRALYGDARHTHQNLMNATEADVATLAALHVATFKDADKRIESLTVPVRNTRQPFLALLYAIFAEVRDLIRVVVHPAGGYTITRDCFVQGVTHNINRNEWNITLETATAAPWTTFSPPKWDTGVWNTSNWFF